MRPQGLMVTMLVIASTYERRSFTNNGSSGVTDTIVGLGPAYLARDVAEHQAAHIVDDLVGADQSDQHGGQRGHANHHATGEEAVQHHGFEFHDGSPCVRDSL